MADPDLQIRVGGGGGGGHPDPEIGGPGLKKFFPLFGPQFGLKIRGDPAPPRAPSLDPPLQSTQAGADQLASALKPRKMSFIMQN